MMSNGSRQTWLAILVEDWPGSVRSLAQVAGLSHTTILRCAYGGMPISDRTLRRLRGACRKVRMDLDTVISAIDDLMGDGGSSAEEGEEA